MVQTVDIDGFHTSEQFEDLKFKNTGEISHQKLK